MKDDTKAVRTDKLIDKKRKPAFMWQDGDIEITKRPPRKNKTT